MKPITTDEFRWFCGKLKDVFPNIEFVGGRQSGAAVEITAVIKKPLPVVPTTENKEISTHALTWSATFRIQFQMFSDWISTHALTWSATLNIVLKKDSPHSIWEVIAFYHQLS